MANFVRQAQVEDVPQMVGLSEMTRVVRQQYQTVFWHKAENSAEVQTPYFQKLLTRDDIIALVHEDDGHINAFVIAAIVPAPPVYDPGGLTCLIDDFCCEHPSDWNEAGVALLKAAYTEAKLRGAVQVSVVTPHLDAAKREMLRSVGLSIASEWWVGSL